MTAIAVDDVPVFPEVKTEKIPPVRTSQAVGRVYHHYQSPQKNKFVAFLLAFLFGPLGMLYSTPGGAVCMLLVSVFAALPTFGLSFIITWPICMIWAVSACTPVHYLR